MAVAYFSLTPLAISGIGLETNTCDQSESLETWAQGTWVGPVFELAIDQPENCAVELQRVSVQRLGSHLFVRTKYVSPSGMYTTCHCRHRTKLRIPGLPRRDFRAHVYSWP
jgi:hypothetical protein